MLIKTFVHTNASRTRTDQEIIVSSISYSGDLNMSKIVSFRLDPGVQSSETCSTSDTESDLERLESDKTRYRYIHVFAKNC